MDVTPDILRKVHMDYMLFAHENGRQYLPHVRGDDRAGDRRVRASSLFSCPIATYYRRAGIAPSHPHLLVENDYATQQRFRDGEDSEDIWQEALLWCGHWGFARQVPFGTETVVGRCDTILDDQWLIEYKKTDYRIPTLKHRGQCALYMRELGLSKGFLILQHRDYNDIWELSKGVGAYLFAATGGAVEVLSDLELDREIERQSFLVASATEPTLRPGECCKEKEDKLYPRNVRGTLKRGELTVRCPYFGWCYGRDGDSYSTDFVDGKLEFYERE